MKFSWSAQEARKAHTLSLDFLTLRECKVGGKEVGPVGDSHVYSAATGFRRIRGQKMRERVKDADEIEPGYKKGMHRVR